MMHALMTIVTEESWIPGRIQIRVEAQIGFKYVTFGLILNPQRLKNIRIGHVDGAYKAPLSQISHFRVAVCLGFKASPSAQPFKFMEVVYFHANQTHHLNELVLNQTQRATQKRPIVRLRNKAIRIINDVPLFDHINPHYAQLGILKLPDIVG